MTLVSGEDVVCPGPCLRLRVCGVVCPSQHGKHQALYALLHAGQLANVNSSLERKEVWAGHSWSSCQQCVSDAQLKLACHV
jgi:hypothetical protein